MIQASKTGLPMCVLQLLVPNYLETYIDFLCERSHFHVKLRQLLI